MKTSVYMQLKTHWLKSKQEEALAYTVRPTCGGQSWETSDGCCRTDRVQYVKHFMGKTRITKVVKVLVNVTYLTRLSPCRPTLLALIEVA